MQSRASGSCSFLPGVLYKIPGSSQEESSPNGTRILNLKACDDPETAFQNAPRTQTHTDTDTYVHINAHTHAYTHIHTYTHARKHKHTPLMHAYTYTRSNRRRKEQPFSSLLSPDKLRVCSGMAEGAKVMPQCPLMAIDDVLNSSTSKTALMEDP